MLFRVSLLLVALASASGNDYDTGYADGYADGFKDGKETGYTGTGGMGGGTGGGFGGGFGGTGAMTASGAAIPLTEDFIRSFDGSEDPRAAPDAELIRLTPNAYPDGLGEDGAGVDNTIPNARLISNMVADPETLNRNRQPGKSRVSDMFWQWGQFMDHDIGLTEEIATNYNFTVTSPDCDNDLICNINMRRALNHKGAGGVREQLNEITGFLDASMVYGHNDARAAALRDTGNAGRMLMTDDGLLPPIIPGVNNAFPDFLSLNAPDQFTGGDIRVNEQLGLLAIHTLWVREHNRLAGILAAAFPESTDEQLFQMARKLVIAEIQAITYKEFLPIMIGSAAPNLDEYRGFNPLVNPGVATEFSACAFRVGHTFLSEELLMHDGVNEKARMDLVDLFFTPGMVRQTPELIDFVLIGQTKQAANQADPKVIPAVRNNLFGAPVSKEGRDLVVFNIMRGRDHGLPRYNTMRFELGLDPKRNFNQVTSFGPFRRELRDAYNEELELCDAWICGLAEDAVNGGELGELFSFIIADQFQRFMDGDEHFYLNDPDVRDQSLINIGIDVDTVTFADVINANTNGMAPVGPDAMLA